jgi:hypothetical protein
MGQMGNAGLAWAASRPVAASSSFTALIVTQKVADIDGMTTLAMPRPKPAAAGLILFLELSPSRQLAPSREAPEDGRSDRI